MTKFDVEFTLKGEDLSLEAERELNRICRDIEFRSKEFKLAESCYTVNISKDSMDEIR